MIMIELIAATILLGSLFGITVILFRKMPVLAKLSLPEEEISLLEQIKARIKKNHFLQPLSLENFLQKLLRRGKILTLKTENQISGWLEQLQQKSENSEQGIKDNYWQELKDSVKSGSSKKIEKDKK